MIQDDSITHNPPTLRTLFGQSIATEHFDRNTSCSYINTTRYYTIPNETEEPKSNSIGLFCKVGSDFMSIVCCDLWLINSTNRRNKGNRTDSLYTHTSQRWMTIGAWDDMRLLVPRCKLPCESSYEQNRRIDFFPRRIPIHARIKIGIQQRWSCVGSTFQLRFGSSVRQNFVTI